MDNSEMVGVSQEFAALAADLRGPGDSNAALRRVVELAVKHIDPVSFASITVVRGEVGSTLASSDPIAAKADELQYALNEGPCLESAREDENLLLFDVATDGRWPNYAAALAEQTSIRSVLAFRLPAQDAAALNLFSVEAGSFTDDDIDVAAILAAQVSSLVAVHQSEDKAAHLEVALESSREIGVAIGVLMAHRKVTRDDAFGLLRLASQRLHRKLRDVAVDVVETGTLPELPPDRAAAVASS